MKAAVILPFSFGLDVPLGTCSCLIGAADWGDPFPFCRTFDHSLGAICSTELIESSDISITDCWNSLVGSGPAGLKVPPGIIGGTGEGLPTVPYRDAPFSRCLAYVESAYAWKEHLQHDMLSVESTL